MSDVKTYTFKGAAGEYVYANDYRAAQSELAALREELERQKRYVEINANSAHGKHKEGQTYRDERDALREELAREKEVLSISVETLGRFANELQISQGKLAAAEQRTAELVSAVRSINRGKRNEVFVPGDDEPQYRQRKEWVDWVLGICDEVSTPKTTESGAGE